MLDRFLMANSFALKWLPRQGERGDRQLNRTIKQMRKKLNLTLMTVCVGTVLLSALPISAQAAASDGNGFCSSAASGNSPSLSVHEITDIRDSGAPKDFSDAIDDLTGGADPIEAGEMRVDKNVYIGEDGLAKIEFDVAALSYVEPADLLFIMDESGSMNMCASSAIDAVDTTPCMNEDHYYEIAYTYEAEENGGKVTGAGTYKLFPSKYSISTWRHLMGSDYSKLTQIKNDIKAQLSDDGINAQKITMTGWGSATDPYNFCDHHYRSDGTKIEMDSSGEKYYSPVNNSNGCYDRMMFAKEQVSEIAAKILARNENNRIGYISFAGEVVTVNSLQHDLPDGLSTFRGYDYTNYYAALTKGAEVISSENTGNKKIVIFITDGVPNRPREDPNGKAMEAARALGEKCDFFYCVGINAGNEEFLKNMANSIDGRYADCKTAEAFRQFMDGIVEEFIMRGDLSDKIGDGFKLICDDEHPITITKGSPNYTDLTPQIETYTDIRDPQLKKTVTYDESQNTIHWRLDSVNAKGTRLSFFVELDQTIVEQVTGTETFYTNKGSELNYSTHSPDGTLKTERVELDYTGQLTVKSPPAPDVPNTPDVPDPPDAPNTPDSPNVPSTPHAPDPPDEITDRPETGAKTGVSLWCVLAVASAAGMVLMALIRRRGVH